MDIFRTKTKKRKSSLSSSYLQRRTYGIAAMILGSAGRPYNRFAPSLSTRRKRKNSYRYFFFSKQNQNKSIHFLTSGSRLCAKLLTLGQDSQGGRATGRQSNRRRGMGDTKNLTISVRRSLPSPFAAGGDPGRACQAFCRGGRWSSRRHSPRPPKPPARPLGEVEKWIHRVRSNDGSL